MNFPVVFLRFTRHCRDLSKDGDWSDEQLIDFSLNLIRSRAEYVELIEFIDWLLASGATDAELTAEWNRTSPGVLMINGTEGFLKDARTLVAKRISMAQPNR